MIRSLLTYLYARFRTIGRCPPHRYTDDEGRQAGFCLDCGAYPVYDHALDADPED